MGENKKQKEELVNEITYLNEKLQHLKNIEDKRFEIVVYVFDKKDSSTVDYFGTEVGEIKEFIQKSKERYERLLEKATNELKKL